MFDYYGSKNSLARYYQFPKHNIIIEPFAGSAGYSLYHLERDEKLRCLLIEKSKRVYDVWNWLKNATLEDLQNYPIPEVGEKTDDFLAMASSASNAFLGSSYMTMTPRMVKRMKGELRRICRIRHLLDRIDVIHGSYQEVDNITGTWFIDPPYQSIGNTVRGMGYSKECRSCDIDYQWLADWCRIRNGQVIVCEQEGACWMPFRSLKSATDSLDKHYTEVVWTNTPDEQMDMFGHDRND